MGNKVKIDPTVMSRQLAGLVSQGRGRPVDSRKHEIDQEILRIWAMLPEQISVPAFAQLLNQQVMSDGKPFRRANGEKFSAQYVYTVFRAAGKKSEPELTLKKPRLEQETVRQRDARSQARTTPVQTRLGNLSFGQVQSLTELLQTVLDAEITVSEPVYEIIVTTRSDTDLTAVRLILQN